MRDTEHSRHQEKWFNPASDIPSGITLKPCRSERSLLPPYLCFSRGRLGSTLVVSPSSGALGEVGDGGESLRVWKEGDGGVRGESLRIGEEGKDGEDGEEGEGITRVLWFQFFCLRVC